MINFKELKDTIQEDDTLALSQASQDLVHHIQEADDFDELHELITEHSGVCSYLYLNKLRKKVENFYFKNHTSDQLDQELALKYLGEIQALTVKWLENQFDIINHIPQRMSYELKNLLDRMLLATKHASLIMFQFKVNEVMEQVDYTFVIRDYLEPILETYEAPFSSTIKAREEAKQLWIEIEQFITLTKEWDKISEDTVMGMTAIIKEYEALPQLESILYSKISIQHMVERLTDYIWEEDNDNIEEVGIAFAAFQYLLESHSLLAYLPNDFYEDEIYVYVNNPLMKDYLECIRQQKWDEAISIAPKGYIPYYYKLYDLFMGYSNHRELNKIVENHLDLIMDYLEKVGEKFINLYEDNCYYLPFIDDIAYDHINLYEFILDKKSYVEILEAKNKQLEEINEQLEEKSLLLEQKNRELELSMMKRRRMVDDFSHAWTNIIKPDIVYHVAESLKQDESYRHHYVALIRAYNDGVLATNECQMLKLTHADTERDPNRIRNFIRKGIALDRSKGKGIYDDIEYIETIMEKEEVYCKKYGLDKQLVDYVSNLDEAIERIQDPKRMSAYDLVLLDIKIEGGINERSKAYLKNIVTVNKIEKYESRYGGFYLYLSLLQEGFPNERIAFLSGYVEEEHESVAVLVSNEPFEQLKALLENHEEIEKAKLKEALAAIKEIVDIEEYSRFMNMLEAGAYLAIKDAIEVFPIEKESQKEVEQEEQEEDTKEIHGHFQAFFDAGIHISEKNKFSKQENAHPPDQEVVFDTPLKKWIKTHDPSGYYSLRYGIIEGCQQLVEGLRKNKLEWDNKIDHALQLYKSDKTEENEKNLKHVLKNKDTYGLEFYKYRHYSDYQKGSYLNHIQYDSTTVAARYPFEYFENMLSTLKWILPVREPSNKGELYNHLIKILTHPWEVAIASYKDSVSGRIQLFSNCISSIAKTTRNWTSHSRLNQFNEQDVAFLFIVLMRTFFKMDLQELKQYEQYLLNYVIKDTTFKNGTIHSNKFLSPDLQNKLTNSLKTLNDRKKQDQAKDLNILNIFSDIGKHQDCDVKDLYLMFTHIACYPWVFFGGNVHLNYNSLYNNIENNDIFSRLLQVSLNKAF